MVRILVPDFGMTNCRIGEHQTIPATAILEKRVPYSLCLIYPYNVTNRSNVTAVKLPSTLP